MPAMDLSSAAASIVAAGRRLGARGLISAAEGNISIRLDDGRLALTPSGQRKDELELDDIVVVSPDDGARSARSASGHGASSDLAIHLAVHAARPDVTVVAHAHLPASLALTLAGEVPDPAVLPETALFIPRVPYLTVGTPGSDELAARIAGALTEPPEPYANIVLLERHGAVAVGPDPWTAIDRLELLEVLCLAWRESLLVRAARATLDPERSPLD
jgi:L-fuculose-phosphate aldolase